MNELVEWLRGVLDEDERVARAADRYWRGVRIESATAAEEDHAFRHNPARVLAEVDAKRRILDQVADWLPANPEHDEPEYAYGYARAMHDAARLLALPDADRPGYREEWRPDIG